jgi:hypothetical protein
MAGRGPQISLTSITDASPSARPALVGRAMGGGVAAEQAQHVTKSNWYLNPNSC